MKDLGEWRPGFYSEFRCASHEHSGLLGGAFFGKTFKKSGNTEELSGLSYVEPGFNKLLKFYKNNKKLSYLTIGTLGLAVILYLLV